MMKIMMKIVMKFNCDVNVDMTVSKYHHPRRNHKLDETEFMKLLLFIFFRISSP